MNETETRQSIELEEKETEKEEEEEELDVQIIESYLQKFFSSKLDASNRESKSSLRRFDTIVAYGRDEERLRAFAFCFAYRYARNRSEDVHLLRADYLPNLISSQSAYRLIGTLSDAAYFDFIKIHYLPNLPEIVDHCLEIDAYKDNDAEDDDNDNDDRPIPGAIIVEDICNYICSPNNNNNNLPDLIDTSIRTIVSDQSIASRSSNRHHHDYNLYSLFRICSLLLETINVCAKKLYPQATTTTSTTAISEAGNESKCHNRAILLLTLDLNKFFSLVLPSPTNDEAEEESRRDAMFRRFVERFFAHEIDVDHEI